MWWPGRVRPGLTLAPICQRATVRTRSSTTMGVLVSVSLPPREVLCPRCESTCVDVVFDTTVAVKFDDNECLAVTVGSITNSPATLWEEL